MSRLKDLVQNSPVHERRLEIKTYPLEDNQVLVEGWLKDDRFVQRYSFGRTIIPPGKVHRIGVRLLLGGWPLTILDAEAEMTVIPHDECNITQESVNGSIGLAITHGYSARILKRIGGPRGCAHMVNLIIAMGNAALQGYWSQVRQEGPEKWGTRDSSQHMEYIVNSCQLWEKDGIMIQKIRQTMDRSGAS